jgi:hypothetical protein
LEKERRLFTQPVIHMYQQIGVFMRTFSYPSWSRDFQDRVTTTGGAGMPGIVQNFELFNRAGTVAASVDFLNEFGMLVQRHEAFNRAERSLAERLKTRRYPNLMWNGWKAELHDWMQKLLDAFLGFHVEVPEPPDLNRAQRRLLKKYQLWLFFVPALEESQYPGHMIKPDWQRYLSGVDVKPPLLPGAWVAFEVIRKPNYQDGAYPDDGLAQEIGLNTRFAHPHSGKGEGDDLMEDLLLKVSKVFNPLGGTTKVQSVRTCNFLGNLFNWLRVNTAENRLPDLGSTNTVEWCAEPVGMRNALIVGDSAHGGLTYVYSYLRDYRSGNIAFRFLVQFPLKDKQLAP